MLNWFRRRKAEYQHQPPPSSPEYRAFLDTILDDLQDGNTLSIFADWLDENDDPRADWVRVQADLQQLRSRQPLSEKETQRSTVLLRQLNQTQAQRLPAWSYERVCTDGVSSGWWSLEGGSFYSCYPASHFLESSIPNRLTNELHASCHYLHVYSAGTLELNLILSAPWLCSVRELRVDVESLGEQAAKSIANSPHLNTLQTLAITNGRLDNQAYVDDETIHALIHAPFFQRLRRLDLKALGLSANAGRMLAEAAEKSQLESVSLAYNEIEDEGAIAWAESPRLAQISELDLRANQIGPQGIAALLHSPQRQKSTTIQITNNHFGQQGAQALLALMVEQQQTVFSPLDVLGSDEIAGISASTDLLKIREAHFYHLNGDAGMLALLVSSPNVQNLEALSLCPTTVDEDDINALAQSPHLSKLRSLNLSGNEMGTEGIQALANAQSLTSLEELCLRDNNVGDQGAVAIAQSKLFSKLRKLDLRDNGISDVGAQALVDSPYLPQSCVLHLEANRISRTTPLHRRFANVHVSPAWS